LDLGECCFSGPYRFLGLETMILLRKDGKTKGEDALRRSSRVTGVVEVAGGKAGVGKMSSEVSGYPHSVWIGSPSSYIGSFVIIPLR
jgi:hypothetical protein